MHRRFGIITPTITPFKNGAIDREATATLMKFLKKGGVAGIFPCGSTGCAPFLDTTQHISVINEYSRLNSGSRNSIPMFPGISRNSVRETVEVARAAIKSEARALVLVTPYYMPLNQDSLFRYFDAMLRKIDFDIIAYNIPQFTGNKIEIGTFERLRKAHRNLIGIKDSSMDMVNFRKMCTKLPEDVLIFQGEDNLLLKSLSYGASGGVCGTTNFDNRAVELFNAYTSGNSKRAIFLQKELDMLMSSLASFEFPLAYNYSFYRKVMHKDAINVVQDFYPNDKVAILQIKRRMAKLLK